MYQYLFPCEEELDIWITGPIGVPSFEFSHQLKIELILLRFTLPADRGLA